MKLLDGNELWVEIYRLEHKRRWKNRTNIAFRECLNVIQFFPKVDAEPVRHGHWIFGETMGHSWMKCSECCVSQSGQTATFTYCPNCGAKMDGGENG